MRNRVNCVKYYRTERVYTNKLIIIVLFPFNSDLVAFEVRKIPLAIKQKLLHFRINSTKFYLLIFMKKNLCKLGPESS